MAITQKYKGITLIEILVYMALFGIVFSLVIGLLIQMRQQNRVARDSIKIEQNMMLIDEHLNTMIAETDSVDELASLLNDDSGSVTLNLKDGSDVEYERVGGELMYVTIADSVPISNQSVDITKFRIEKVLDEDSILIGIRVSCTVASTHDASLVKSWENFYYIQ